MNKPLFKISGEFYCGSCTTDQYGPGWSEQKEELGIKKIPGDQVTEEQECKSCAPNFEQTVKNFMGKNHTP